MFNPFRRNRYWRVNLGVGQLRSLGFTGIDDFRNRSGADVLELKLDPAEGEKIDRAELRRGDRFLLTGLYQVGGAANAALSHVAIATGVIDDFSFPAGAARLHLKKFKWLAGDPSVRAAPKPRCNIEPLPEALKARFFDGKRAGATRAA